MARPKRLAALRALESFQNLFDEESDDGDDRNILSSSEEDELDIQLGLHGSDVEESDEEESCDEAQLSRQGHTDKPDQPMTCNDEDIMPEVPTFTPKHKPGATIDAAITRIGKNKFVRAIDFFNLFFTEALMQMIVTCTNIYGDIHILEKPTYAGMMDGSWQHITLDEMRRFLALVIFMGFIRRADAVRYWSQKVFYSGGWAPRFVSRNRFKAILAMLHVVDPMKEDPDDKLTKIRPMLNHVKHACRTVCQPQRELSADERMVRSKARSGLIQYIPSKHCRFGFKLWCLCEAKTGYTLDFDVYTGKQEERSEHGLGYSVVSKLMENFNGVGHAVFFDNFFTSLPLINHLHSKGTVACGTTLPSRRGYPEAMKDKTWMKKAKKGDMRWKHENGILCIQWQDKKPVCVCSTGHSANEFVTANRYVKSATGGYAKVPIRKPAAVHDYNMYMGGVDLSDQLLHPYGIRIKSVRWWKTLFFHLVDVSILNSFILFEAWRRDNPDIVGLQRPAGYSQLCFREELTQQLAQIDDDELPPLYQIPHRRPSVDAYYVRHMPLVAATHRNCRVCYAIHKKEQKTRWKCPEAECNVHLCMNVHRNCYRRWHSAEFDALR